MPAVAVLLLVLADQVTKHLVAIRIPYHASIPVLPFLNWVHVRNTGIAFSMFPNTNMVFAAVTAAALVAIGVWSWRHRGPLPRTLSVSLVLIASGAGGNLLDRLFRGAVVDFIDLWAGAYHWPAFNIADSCITVGGALLCLFLLRNEAYASPTV